MADEKPNAASRPNQGVRRTATHSGVTHVRTYQSGRYVVVGNHLAQHRELSLTAIGLATHVLSLPEGAPVDIRSLADRFPEGRDRIAFALRELEAQGYLERVRERTDAGRLFTRTYAHHTPVRTDTDPIRGRTAPAPGRAPRGRPRRTTGPGSSRHRPRRPSPRPRMYARTAPKCLKRPTRPHRWKAGARHATGTTTRPSPSSRGSAAPTPV